MASVTKFVGTGANTARGGSSVSWSSPGNVTANDGSVSDVDEDLKDLGYTDYLTATMSGNVFAIAGDQVIDGVEVEVEIFVNGTSSGRSEVEDLILVSSLGDGDDKGDDYQLTTTPTIRTYGGAADTWGLALTPAVVNATSFGAKLAVLEALNGNGKRPRVDFIRITVYHSDESPGEPEPSETSNKMMVL